MAVMNVNNSRLADIAVRQARDVVQHGVVVNPADPDHEEAASRRRTAAA